MTMDVTKVTQPVSEPSRSTPGAVGERAAAPSGTPAVPEDLSGIKALDLASAVRILLSEVMLALSELPSSATVPPAGPSAAMVEQAVSGAEAGIARTLVEVLLRFVPAEDLPPESIERAVLRLQTTLDDAGRAAIARVAAWRNTPAVIVEMLDRSRTMALAVLGDDAPALAGIRAEWLGLAPRLMLLRRRMRRRTVWMNELDADHVDLDDLAQTEASRKLHRESDD